MQAMAGFGLSKWCPAVAAASDRLNRERECVAEVGDPRLSGSSTLHSREHPVSRAGHPQAGRLISELAWATLRDLGVLIKSKETSSRELVAEHLDNVEAMNPAVNAIVTLDVERSLAEAAYADELLASGTHFGPLHGIPAAFSDAHETARMRTTFGSPLYKHHVSDHDDITVARMRSAGAIIIRKTNVPEFTTGCNTFNPLFGATRNPYNLGRTAGDDGTPPMSPRPWSGRGPAAMPDVRGDPAVALHVPARGTGRPERTSTAACTAEVGNPMKHETTIAHRSREHGTLATVTDTPERCAPEREPW